MHTSPLSLLQQIQENLLMQLDTKHERKEFLKLLNNSGSQAQVLIGERGVGKTTLLLQYLKTQNNGFYFSVDNSIITDLNQLVVELVLKKGIDTVIIDEIHTYPERQQHLKSIIDALPQIQLIVSGSSSLDLYEGTSALARRTNLIQVPTLSFGEYCLLQYDFLLPKIQFEQLISDHEAISFTYNSAQVEIYFDEYLKHGFYPYTLDKTINYHDTLRRNLQKTIIFDIPTFLNFETDNLHKIEKLFYFIAHTPPSDFNYTNMSKKLGISPHRLETVISYLEKIGVINLMVRSNKLSDIMRKEYKALLGNPNMYHAYTQESNRGSIRESFVTHALRKVQNKQILPDEFILPHYGDIIFSHNNTRYLFEIGGKRKSDKQIAGIKNSYVVSDIMLGTQNKIPLWLFGLLE